MKYIQSPILRGLLINQEKDNYRFHMPGHKGKLLEIYKPLVDNLFALDFTEITGTDDLYNSNDFLKTGMDLLAKDRKSKKSFYLTNGTTVGILASIMALTAKDDFILISKECHKSVYNAIELNSLNPIILENQIDSSGLTYPIDENDFIDKLKDQPLIKMVVLSRPNYFGFCTSISNLVKYCLSNNIYLVIDEAHGSHFVYNKTLPSSAMELGAHISVNSFHKTLPALTQSSVLNLNYNLSDIDCSKVLAMVEKLQSSSPSYLLMASIDIARTYMANYGTTKLNSLFNYIQSFYNSIKNLDWIKPIDENSYFQKDISRIILKTKIPAKDVQQFLEKNNIYIEMISKNILVLISTTEDTLEDFTFLATTLKNFTSCSNPKKEILNKAHNCSKPFLNGQLVSLDYSKGKKLKENIIIYPPGTVYLKIGDTILQEDINYLKDLITSGINVYTDFNKDINNLYVSID